MEIKYMKKFTYIFIILTFALTAFASDQAGVISAFEGKVLLFDGVSPRSTDVTEPNTAVFINNKIATKRDSTAMIELVSGDRIALTEGAIMSILGNEEFKPWDGKVLFHIRKRGQASGVKVALKSAVIGVKGTKFLVSADKASGNYDVFLKEGKIECLPAEGQFKMYKDVVMDEYEAYVKKMTGEFEDYLAKLEEDFVEYVDKFEMKPGDAFSVSGNEVRKVEYTKEIEDAFKILDDM